MRNYKYAYIGFVTGLIGLIFLPIGFKALAFFFPGIFLCLTLNRDKYNFNLWLFVVILFPFLFIPSQAFNFDASQPFDIKQFSFYANTYTIIIVSFIFYGVPTFFIGIAMYGIMVGKVDSASKLLIRVIMLMGVMFVFLYIIVISGYDFTGGILTGVGNYYISLIVTVFRFPTTMYNVVRGGIISINSIIKGIEKTLETIADPTGELGVDYNFATLPELDPLPSYDVSSNLTFDASYREFNSMSYNTHIYAIHDILPIIMTGMCLITALFMTRESWEKQIIKKIDELFGEEKIKEKEIEPHVSYSMIIYMLVIMVCGWTILLAYGRSFGINPVMDWRMILFIFYSVIIFGSVIMLNTMDIFYDRATFTNTITGTILGVITLKLITMMFTPQVLDAYSNENLHNDLGYIALTFIFVAPAESIFFFVVFPGVIFSWILSRVNKKLGIMFEEERKAKLYAIEVLIDFYKQSLEVFKLRAKTKKTKKITGFDKRWYEWTQERIVYLENKRRKLEARKRTPTKLKKAVFGRINTLSLFILLGVFVPAFLFSTLHYPMIHYSTGMDFMTYWNCGLGMIYFCCAIFFILLSMNSGYQSGIQSHAVFNTLTIWMVVVCLGV